MKSDHCGNITIEKPQPLKNEGEEPNSLLKIISDGIVADPFEDKMAALIFTLAPIQKQSLAAFKDVQKFTQDLTQKMIDGDVLNMSVAFGGEACWSKDSDSKWGCVSGDVELGFKNIEVSGDLSLLQTREGDVDFKAGNANLHLKISENDMGVGAKVSLLDTEQQNDDGSVWNVTVLGAEAGGFVNPKRMIDPLSFTSLFPPKPLNGNSPKLKEKPEASLSTDTIKTLKNHSTKTKTKGGAKLLKASFYSLKAKYTSAPVDVLSCQVKGSVEFAIGGGGVSGSIHNNGANVFLGNGVIGAGVGVEARCP